MNNHQPATKLPIKKGDHEAVLVMVATIGCKKWFFKRHWRAFSILLPAQTSIEKLRTLIEAHS